MVKCYQHIGTTSDEWCWKCQELTDNDRFNSNKIINEIQPKQVAEIICGLDNIKRNKIMYTGRWKESDRDARMYFYYDVVLGLVYYSGI